MIAAHCHNISQRTHIPHLSAIYPCTPATTGSLLSPHCTQQSSAYLPPKLQKLPLLFIPDNDFLPRSHILLHHIDIPYEIITCAVKHPRQQHQPLQARQTSAIFKTAYIFAICIDKIPQLLLCEVHRLAGILYSLPNNNTVQFFLLPIRPRGQQYYFTIKSQNKKPHPMRTFHIRCDF